MGTPADASSVSLRDTLTGGSIEDPVRAMDGALYDRASIEAWFSACKKSKVHGGKIVSPLTHQPMAPTLMVDETVAQEVQRRRDQVERGETLLGQPVAPPFKSITMLSEVFELLDHLGAYLKQSVLDADDLALNPPVIIALGNESSGKSSILERLTMMPLLPCGFGTCTRLPVMLRLRHRAHAELPRLRVIISSTGACETEYPISLVGGEMDVRREMNRLVAEEHADVTTNGKLSVSMRKHIELAIHSPIVPSIDLLDLPGLKTNPAVYDTPDMPEKVQVVVQ